MREHEISAQDAAVFSRAMQDLLLAAFAQANLDPFLKKILEILSRPGGLGRRASLAILMKDHRGRPLCAFWNVPRAERRALEAGAAKAFSGQRGTTLRAAIRPAGAPAGLLLARLEARPKDAGAARGLAETAAKIIAARVADEKRDAELNAEKDVAASVKHVEELYLAYPGISIEEISRAVLDEARRLTGSEFGFTSYVDPASGCLMTASIAAEASGKCRMESRPVAFKELKGLWGWVIKRKKPLLTNAAPRDRRAAGLPNGHVKIDKFLGVPAMSGRRLLGILALANPAGDYSERDLDAAQKLARVYAIILQRKAAEDRQREEDTRFRTIISSSKDVIYTASLDGRITFASPKVEDYGYGQREVLGRSIVEFAHPDDKDFVVKAFANAVRTGRTLPILPYRVRRKDGTYFYAEQKSGIVFSGGKPAYITGVIRDVTDQKVTELRLKESEALMRMVFDNARDAIFIKDMNGMYVKANKACADLMNTTPEAMIGRSDSDYLGREAAEAVFRSDSEVVRSGRTLSLNNLHPFPAGSRYVNIVKTPLKNAAGETVGILGIARDISELKRMEAELATARAAEAVSKVARPMAHDFNNALAAINGYATLIDDGLTRDNPIKNEITQIIKAVGRAAELMNQFQDFARNPKLGGQGGHHA